ncbi:uncharacterized protein PRCAT00000217001 [Priceomyces carsonii]|uniref:uncharacterized protein n=1 Tax=Priceomyces carsonii TaxID=28549 RepID=UPI002EDA645D|nr:unnamed protein product [Priceomyces carsonii]
MSVKSNDSLRDGSRESEVSQNGLGKETTVSTNQNLPLAIANSTTKSIGVRKIEILNAQYENIFLRIILFVCVFFVAYCYGLDGTVRGTLQNYATDSYNSHPLYSTVNVIKSVVAAAAQPTYARLSDRFGRLELVFVSMIFYSMGTIIESQAYDIKRFAGGAVLYQIGYSGIIILLQVIVADLSNLNWRLAVSFVPALPFIINTWVSAEVVNSLYPTHSWNYGIGIWAFIFPLSCVPLIACMLYMWIKARVTPEYQALLKEQKLKKNWVSKSDNIFVHLFWELDLIGILFIICVFGFILVPLTIAGGVQSTWQKASTIVPLVIGFVLIPFFVLWEGKYAKFPIMPLPLMRDRGVWSALMVAIMIDFVWYMPNDYMYTVLIVGMRSSIKAANRIVSLYSFVSCVTGPLLGLVIVKFRRLKGFIIFGVVCWIIATGILVHFRGDNNGIDSEKYLNGVIGALCLMGFGAGFYTYSTQVSISTCTNHEYMAVIISLYLASYNIGAAIGTSVSGAVWTNVMYNQIVQKMSARGVDTSLATQAYGAPFDFIIENTWGTDARIAVVLAYAHVQKILCIIGLVLCFPLLGFTFFLRDHRLDSVQSLEIEHSHEEGVKFNDEVVVNNYDDDILVSKIKSLFRRRNKE